MIPKLSKGCTTQIDQLWATWTYFQFTVKIATRGLEPAQKVDPGRATQAFAPSTQVNTETDDRKTGLPLPNSLSVVSKLLFRLRNAFSCMQSRIATCLPLYTRKNSWCRKSDCRTMRVVLVICNEAPKSVSPYYSSSHISGTSTCDAPPSKTSTVFAGSSERRAARVSPAVYGYRVQRCDQIALNHRPTPPPTARDKQDQNLVYTRPALTQDHIIKELVSDVFDLCCHCEI